MKTVTVNASQYPELDVHDGDSITGLVVGNKIQFTVIAKSLASKKQDGSTFLKKWSGALKEKSFHEEDHEEDPRMLHYIEKYGLDA